MGNMEKKKQQIKRMTVNAVQDEMAKEAGENLIPTWKKKPQHTPYTDMHKDNKIEESNENIKLYLQYVDEKHLKVSSEVVERLRLKRDKNDDQLLLNSSKIIGSDSKEMRKIKQCVSDLDTNLMQLRHNAGQPVASKEMDALMEQYNAAILACHSYVTNPKKNSENARYKAVRRKMVQLMAEQEKMSAIHAKMEWNEARGKSGFEADKWTSVHRLIDLLITGALAEEGKNARKNDEKLLEQSEHAKMEQQMKEVREAIHNNNMLQAPAKISAPKTEDPTGKFILDLLSGNLSTPLVVNTEENDEQKKLDAERTTEKNIRIAQYLFGQLSGLAAGQSVYIDTAVLFSGKFGVYINQYTDQKGKTKRCDTLIRLRESSDKKLYLSCNGQEETEFLGKNVILTYLASKIFDCQDYMDKKKDGFGFGEKGEEAGKKAVDKTIRYLENISFDPEMDYSGANYRKLYDMVYTLTARVINQRMQGFDGQSMIKKAKIQDMMKAMIYIVKNPYAEIEAQNRDDYIVKVQRFLGIMNRENMDYVNLNENYVSLLEKNKGDEGAIREQALDFISKITLIYKEASQFKEMSAEQLHKDAQDLCAGKISSTEYMRKLLKNNEKRFVAPKEGAMTINSEETLDMMKQRDEQFINKNITVQKKERAKSNGPKWTESQAATKELIAELFYSRDTWEEDLETEKIVKSNSDEKFIKFFSKEQNVKALAQILKNPELIKETLNRISFLKNDAEAEKGKNGEDIASKLRDMMTKPFKGIEVNENTTIEEIVASINKVLARKDYDTLKDFEASYDNLTLFLGDFMRNKMNEIQKNLDKLVSNNLVDKKKPSVDEEEEEEDIQIEGAKKELTEEEKKARQKIEDQQLINRLNKNNLTGQTGQAQFLQKLLCNYFSQVCDMDQRSIIAGMLREAAPIPSEKDLKKVEPDYSDLEGKKMDKKIKDAIKTERQQRAKREMEKSKQQYGEDIKRAEETCLSGMIKGSGPLFQKLLQGIQMDGVPRLLKNAMADVRSNLLPIPEGIVKARLAKLVKDSDGQITGIKIVDSQGAASVAETFLARIYGPKMPKEGKEVIIKMLRPDIQTRMEREVDVIEGLAKEVGEAVELSYHGTYMRIQEELDFRAEEKNIRFGEEHYNRPLKIGIVTKENVHSMKVCNKDRNEPDIMLLEKAEGVTLDKHIRQEKKKMAQNFSDDFEFDEAGNLDTTLVHADGKLQIMNGMHDKGYYLRKKEAAAKIIHELQIHQQYLVELVEKWTIRAFYETGKNGEYFFHGDLHTGNIMIDKNGATLIDYGNATFLSSDQRTAMLNLIAAAAAMEDVTQPVQWALNELVKSVQTANDAEKQAILADYKTKEQQLLRKVEKILTKGSTSTIGIKLALIFSEMQNMGIPLPPAISNYAQAQIRLQNSMDSYNTLIEEAKLIHDTYDQSLKQDFLKDEFDFNYEQKLSEYLSDFETEEDKQEHRNFYKATALYFTFSGAADLKDALADSSREGIKEFEELFMGQYLLDRGEDKANEKAKNEFDEIKVVYAEYRALQKSLNSNDKKPTDQLEKLAEDVTGKLQAFYFSYIRALNQYTDDEGNFRFLEMRTPGLFFLNVLYTSFTASAYQIKTKDGLQTVDLSSEEGDASLIDNLKTLFGDAYNTPKIQNLMKDFKKNREEWRSLDSAHRKQSKLTRWTEKVCLEALKIYLKKIDSIDGTIKFTDFDTDAETTFSEAVAYVIADHKFSTQRAVGIWGTAHAYKIAENFGFI